MASSSSSSSITASKTRYDVFLSFRGTDTRLNFTGHLYAALCRKHVKTFIDEHDLERGEYISPNLLKAIEESKYSIVIFSQNYASSRWCLDELVKILECMKSLDRKVFPIFYHVEPTHLRKQEGDFGEAFKQLEERFKGSEDRVEKWRSALKEAADLSGEVFSNNRHESELIEEIAELIMKKLYPISFIASNQLVGIDIHIQQMLSCLEMDLIGVRCVGLWGMSGIGKTTIAEIVYGQISYQFEHCCFFRNIREESEKIGLSALRNRFFYKLLGIEIPDVDMLCVLPAFIADKLSRSKVLVVLDDVTDLNQLEAFGVREGWFGPGSRIIVTSRDKQVLNIVVDEIYEVEGLNLNDALQLLSMKAFKQMQPQKGYEELSEKVVNYAGGVPLALIVLGSHLHKRLPDKWQLQLNKLEQSPEPSIQRILKISYDGLEEDMLKDIFLDIACFFKGCTVNSVTDILDGWGIDRLSEKCLITIRDNKLEMHDLIQDMGRDIARRRGNLMWNHEDIYHLLTTNMRNEAVEGVLLDMSRVENVPLSSTALDMSHSMPNLRLLKFYRHLFWQKKQHPVFTVETSQSNNLLQLPHKLRLLHWEEYPFESLPLNFFMQNLVDLTLSDSSIIQLWDGKGPENLKRLDLSHSVQLRRLPDLSSATKMEKICLANCQSLVEIPHSIQCLNNLTDLFLDWCKNLRSIPSIANLISLTRLNLSYCPNLKMLPEIPRNIEWIELEQSGFEVWSSIPVWKKVRALNMKNCKSLASLPSLVHLKSLDILNLAGCSNLTMLPEIPNCIKRLELQMSGIVEWSPCIGNLENLRFLDMSFCKNLRSFPSLIYSESLHTISLQGCTDLKILPEIPSSIKILELENSGLEDLRWCWNLCKFPDYTGSLEKLILDELAIRELPSSIRCFSSSIHELSMRKCKNLEILPESICELKCLQTLDLSDCSKLAELPPLNGLNSLERLVLNGCFKLAKLPVWNGLNSLESLKLSGNAMTTSPGESPPIFVEWKVENLKNLEILPVLDFKCVKLIEIENCFELVKLPSLNGLSSLQKLHLIRCGITEIPTELPSSLVDLIVDDCSNFTSLPDNVCELKCLQTLILRKCSSLEKLPPLNGLSSLKRLEIISSGIIGISTELPSSLVDLIVDDCSNFTSLPDNGCELKCLQTLILRKCSSLEKLPPLNGLSSLKKLEIINSGIIGISTELHSSLVDLIVADFSNFMILPDNFFELKCLQAIVFRNCSSLEKLPRLSGLSSLKRLEIISSGITGISTELPSSLVELIVDDCSNFLILPENICESKCLQTLILHNCSSLEKLPAELPSSLVYLRMVGCKNLKILPDNISELKCLQTLHLNGCLILEKLPPLNDLNSLIELDLSGSGIVEIPAELPSSLHYLILLDCQFLRILPHSILGSTVFGIYLNGFSLKLLPLDVLQLLSRTFVNSGRVEIIKEIIIRNRLSYRVRAAIRSRIKWLQKHTSFSR